MRFGFLASALLFLFFVNVQSPGNSGGQSPPPALTPGKVLPRIQCAAQPEQSYAIYLPSSYFPDHRWPLVISSDPGARGNVPLELQKDAAERFGYVLVASNNSRNGPWKPRLEATEVMLKDVQARVSVDNRRVYFAGFSGGARASVEFAVLCKCATGVLLSGAGFPGGVVPAAGSALPVFSAVGTFDFNYGEVVQLQDALAKAGYPHWLRIFEGSHEWATPPVMEEAFAWFRVQAMKAQREPRDQAFIDEWFSKAQARASSFEQSGDLLNAWREYLQIADTYDSLVDVRAIRAKADALGKGKHVRDAAKCERNEILEQASLTASIAAAITSPNAAEPSERDNTPSPNGDIAHLRDLSLNEKRPEKARIYKRAILEVFVMAVEAGQNFLETKDYSRAVDALEAATQARPESEYAWRDLAVANADAGKTKQALSALERARAVSSDVPSFQEWLKSEPGFDRLRSSAQFQTLLGVN